MWRVIICAGDRRREECVEVDGSGTVDGNFGLVVECAVLSEEGCIVILRERLLCGCRDEEGRSILISICGRVACFEVFEIICECNRGWCYSEREIDSSTTFG